jgi:hypothetical protein
MARIEIQVDDVLLDDLSRKFFWQDYQPQPLPEKFRDAAFHIVDRVNGLRIMIWADEHPPPHFHVSYQGQDASFSILDCSRLPGVSGLERYEVAIFDWWLKNRDVLIAKWNSLRPTDCSVGPITQL